MTQYGFFVDSSRCTGCKTCQVSCKDNKDLDVGPKFRRVYEYGGGEWIKQGDAWQNSTFSYYLSIACNHCDEPTCVQGCPTGAMHKREQDGLVVVNEEVCVGCRYCEMRCPYGAPQFDPVKKVMRKCDGCFDRLEQGLHPICVDSCPQRALEFGKIDQLRAKYGDSNEIAPLPSSQLTKPNLIVKAHPNARPTGDTQGSIQNPSEV
ncbi:DMSO/selenate family reductase complex B subunit [Budvicia aquatica]|uniref:DMSO reductase iron-sulfur subunit n=1 Tax=Budvicia aquatica TaxID=82979 RepID=A0A2C6DPV0_9GAMM|nr:DMSO/selenate family reductase complex B subunit [Budvicia aquatica]PHI30362.1 dimethylsulfoxide reductase, chain B [Budvicia aquatica]VFS49481.1 DMSO reductase iron-sulfur subunit [Budvicia aquatica]